MPTGKCHVISGKSVGCGRTGWRKGFRSPGVMKSGTSGPESVWWEGVSTRREEIQFHKKIEIWWLTSWSIRHLTARHVRRLVGDRWVTPNGLVGRFVGWRPQGAPADTKKNIGRTPSKTPGMFSGSRGRKKEVKGNQGCTSTHRGSGHHHKTM